MLKLPMQLYCNLSTRLLLFNRFMDLIASAPMLIFIHSSQNYLKHIYIDMT